MVKITDISSPLIFGTRGGGGGGGGGIAKQVILLSVTSAPSGTFKKGSQYFNSTDKLIYTAIDDNTWNGARTSVPQFGVIYIFNDNGVTRYYVWDGDNLVESDLEKYQLISNKTDDFTESSSTKYPTSKALKDGLATKQDNLTAGASIKIENNVISVIGEGEIGVVALVAMNSQPSTPYVEGSRWFYNGLIYTATSTTQTDGGKTPSTQATYLFEGVNYYWDGSQLQSVPQGNLVHISGEETITGPKTFAGGVNLGDNATAQTKPTSDTSDAVATTKFVKDFAQDGEWQKPDDWVDIRSGALDNSVYFLVAHSKPTGTPGSYTIADYANFALMVRTSTTTNTYDVYIDDIKVATTASFQKTSINFEQLYNDGILQGGYDIASPGEGNYTSHIIRVSPSVDTDTLTLIHTSLPVNASAGYGMGCLWVHFEIENEISIHALLADDIFHNYLCQAVTAKNNTLKFVIASSGVTGLRSAFFTGTDSNLKKLPVLVANNSDYDYTHRRDFLYVTANKIVIKNNSKKMAFGILKSFRGQYFETENPMRLYTGYGNNGILVANLVYNLKRLPAISNEKADILVMTRLDSLEPTTINESFNDERTCFRIYGASEHLTNLVGLVVSNKAPFNYVTAPQLSVAYTKMDRMALVKLFKSLPSHIGYIINGEPTNNDGVFSGFSNVNYLTMNKALPDLDNNSDFEVILRVTAPNPISQGLIFGSFITNSDVSLQLDGDNNLYGYIYDSANSVRREIMLQQAFTAGQATWVKYSIKNGTLTIGVSADKITWREANLVLPDNFAYTKKTIPVFGGYTGETDNAFDGSIDMPQSYIMKDGLPWFTGDGIARTLDCTACTGTAYLTEDDKAIAENKGWSLILA